MLVLKTERGELIGKMFKTQLGYYYKIYKNKQVVAISYVFLKSKKLCLERMHDDIDLLLSDEKVKLL